MRNIIVGTAGHIDHGKSALVRALTGIETDRLEEEKRRGISIDLGFAHLELGDGLRLGFVDVPGHERFVRNMLAGAGGIDMVLFVVGADESIKPQTREHFDICRLLGVKKGIVVLTKADLVDPEILELARMEVEEFVAGSFLARAPVVAMSSKTGQGIDVLKSTLATIANQVVAKSSTGLLRLPIDRSFAMKGFGTVVTGTLVSGAMAVEQEVEIPESGLRLRVRGLQVHGASAKRAVAGQRTAVNLAGVDSSQLGRGMTVAEPDTLKPRSIVDCEFQLLSSAKPLKHRAPVHFHAWTSETEAEVRLIEGKTALQPGQTGLVRIALKNPVVLLPGDRFIVRMFSPVVTIGGGRVLDIAMPARQKWSDAAARLRKLVEASSGQRIEMLIEESRFGMSVGDLVARTGLTASQVSTELSAERFVFLPPPMSWAIGKTWLETKSKRIHERLASFHRTQPLLPGVSKEEIRSREMEGAPDFLLDALVKLSRTFVADGESLRLASHQLHLKQDEEAALAKIEGAFEQAGLSVPALSDVLAQSGVEAARACNLLQILFRQKRLVRISEELVFHPTAISSLKQMLSVHKGEKFGVGEFKEWTGISRKYAIPLLEFLDRERVTRREGDSRQIL